MIIKKKMAVINVKHKKDMLLETVIDSHIIKIDVPKSMGEKNRSPLLLSSLSFLWLLVLLLLLLITAKMPVLIPLVYVELSFDKLANPTRLGNLNTVNN